VFEGVRAGAGADSAEVADMLANLDAERRNEPPG
jgi:hypothetical protein